MRWLVSDADDTDLAAILAIYNDAIANTTAVYTDELATIEQRAAWLAERRALDLPVIVARDRARRVGGFASFGPFRPWPGYAATVEHSVYTSPDVRRQGIASSLLEALVERAQAREYQVMIGGIDAANVASLALHERLGFVRAGHLHRVARKFGSWVDLVFVEKQLEHGREVCDLAGCARSTGLRRLPQ
jgi:L-amino acid N-acyltransferase